MKFPPPTQAQMVSLCRIFAPRIQNWLESGGRIADLDSIAFEVAALSGVVVDEVLISEAWGIYLQEEEMWKAKGGSA